MTDIRRLNSADYKRLTDALDEARGLEILAREKPMTLAEKVALLRRAKVLRCEASLITS